MKFGLFIDKSAQESFQIRDGKSYLLNSDIPYTTKHSIGSDTHMGIFQYPFLFGDNGYFINMKKTKLPSIDFDIIFLVRERWPEEFTMDKIRSKYPNAKIFSVLKEQWPVIDEMTRCNVLAECDDIIFPFKLDIENQPGFTTSQFKNITGREAIWLPQPYDTDYLYEKFYKQERKYDVFSYVSPTMPHLRRAETEKFTKYMSDKYNLTVRRIMTDNWYDYMEETSNCTYMFNLDATRTAGQCGIQAAILGVVAFGSKGDSNHHLFPNSCDNNFDKLEDEFNRIINDTEYHINVIQKAFTDVEKIYGVNNVKQKIIDLYNA